MVEKKLTPKQRLKRWQDEISISSIDDVLAGEGDEVKLEAVPSGVVCKFSARGDDTGFVSFKTGELYCLLSQSYGMGPSSRGMVNTQLARIATELGSCRDTEQSLVIGGKYNPHQKQLGVRYMKTEGYERCIE